MYDPRFDREIIDICLENGISNAPFFFFSLIICYPRTDEWKNEKLHELKKYRVRKEKDFFFVANRC